MPAEYCFEQDFLSELSAEDITIPQVVYALEYAYHLLGDATGKTVLDYGCGAGENSVLIASHGGKPVGVDISPDLIELARRRMKLHDFTDYDFQVGSAHELPLADESVDIVFGNAILHHLDLSLSAKEVFRVLKKGGRAIFLEPVRNSKFIWFVRNLIPYQAPDISLFERPLTDTELKDFAKDFGDYKSRAFSLPFVNLLEVARAAAIVSRFNQSERKNTRRFSGSESLRIYPCNRNAKKIIFILICK